MGRSVDYLTYAKYITYKDVSEFDEEFDWDYFEQDLIERLQLQFPSLEDDEKWDGGETKIILSNSFVEIGISEYCGLASISVRINDGSVYDYDYNLEGLAERFIVFVGEFIVKNFGDLQRIGGFSDGTSVYERADEKS